ncbi:superoxide dismutase [Cu-Zn] [Nomia melanderi]|uniref:superoxide dismutase [Cu-Zn] n=1 Tax=Nomia melanderi TaxID=2448451 RepID=UPI001303F762|nr:superoxide dismutase [Cu-Zn]-like [Nomia melanderi]
MNRLVILFLAVIVNSASSKTILGTPAAQGTTCATVELVAAKPHENNVTGSLNFRQEGQNGPVKIVGTIHGLAKGLHGFHVHQDGKLGNGCLDAGPHFNPHMVHHCGPDCSERHVGDLGNIWADACGTASIDITDSVISLHGDHSIVGRAIVVHSGEDDLGTGSNLESLKTGNAGGRLACGTIALECSRMD